MITLIAFLSVVTLGSAFVAIITIVAGKEDSRFYKKSSAEWNEICTEYRQLVRDLLVLENASADTLTEREENIAQLKLNGEVLLTFMEEQEAAYNEFIKSIRSDLDAILRGKHDGWDRAMTTIMNKMDHFDPNNLAATSMLEKANKIDTPDANVHMTIGGAAPVSPSYLTHMDVDWMKIKHHNRKQ